MYRKIGNVLCWYRKMYVKGQNMDVDISVLMSPESKTVVLEMTSVPLLEKFAILAVYPKFILIFW